MSGAAEARDRHVQDEVIRALADARYRRSAGWRGRRLADDDRVERFARFLARHFYRERIVHFFKYSRALSRWSGRTPESAVDTPAFDALLDDVVLGSRETAVAVADLVLAQQRAAPNPEPAPYAQDLLRYEQAMMVVEAGPRELGANRGGDRDAGDGPEADPDDGRLVVAAEGSLLVHSDFDLPAVLPALLAHSRSLPSAPRRATRLLVARTPSGRVSALIAGDDVLRVVEAASSPATVAHVGDRSGLEASRAAALVDALEEVGALRVWHGS